MMRCALLQPFQRLCIEFVGAWKRVRYAALCPALGTTQGYADLTFDETCFRGRIKTAFPLLYLERFLCTSLRAFCCVSRTVLMIIGRCDRGSLSWALRYNARRSITFRQSDLIYRMIREDELVFSRMSLFRLLCSISGLHPRNSTDRELLDAGVPS